MVFTHYFSQLSIQEHWLHVGTVRNRKFIPVHKAVAKVGPDVINLLPIMRALTECDSTSRRHRQKGRVDYPKMTLLD